MCKIEFDFRLKAKINVITNISFLDCALTQNLTNSLELQWRISILTVKLEFNGSNLRSEIFGVLYGNR